MKQNLHTHTRWSDGINTPEEMILQALSLQFNTIGISDHSYTSFDDSYCLKRDALPAYLEELHALKKKYAGRIIVLAGIEQDYYSDFPAEGVDYIIGSVHAIRVNGHMVPVDLEREILEDAVRNDFGGDAYALAECYFETVSHVVEQTHADIIGHFDLIAKLNRGNCLFDEHHPRYVAAWKAALDRLLLTGRPFELNSGALYRGYRDVPYPAPEMISYIRARGGQLLPTSDAHRAEDLGKLQDPELF